MILQDYLERHSHEVPPRSTVQRVKKYDDMILYFSSLSFSRPGVKVNPNFLRALMSAESAGDPYAVSNKNAIGLTQITPETGKIAARALYEMNYDFKFVDEEKLADLQPSDLFDPAINLLICTYLMDKYNQAYGDNLALTVSAWNAGPGAVRQYRGYPPYDETLTLIARVNYYYLHYQKQYFWY
jgi:soluble lytic murein transglycosylase-like protein